MAPIRRRATVDFRCMNPDQNKKKWAKPLKSISNLWSIYHPLSLKTHKNKLFQHITLSWIYESHFFSNLLLQPIPIQQQHTLLNRWIPILIYQSCNNILHIIDHFFLIFFQIFNSFFQFLILFYNKVILFSTCYICIDICCTVFVDFVLVLVLCV